MALEQRRAHKRFPWWPLIILLATAYLFWVLPHQLPDKPIDIVFEEEPAQE